MIVEKARLAVEEDEARIVAVVRSEAGHFAPFELVIGVPRVYVGWLDVSGNPYVPTLLLLAGVVKEPLRLAAPVSPMLLANAAAAGELFRSWWGIVPVPIEAEPAGDERVIGGGTALFFTRGVDSWHSALRGTAGEWPQRPTHLLYAADLDRHYSPPTRRRALGLTAEAAGCLGLPLIPISYNGRELLDRFVNWERSHGGVLAGIGLTLGGGVANLVIASSYDNDHLIPWGSHPALDPLWSTERTTVRIDGLEVTRTEKVKALADSPFAPARLKVCWRADIDTNCGRCDKCIRTQCALAIAGALERAPVFLQPLTVQAVADLPRPVQDTQPGSHDPLWVELCESFPADPALEGLRAAAYGRLPPWHRLAMSCPESDAPAIVIEAPGGAATTLLPASIAAMLPAPVTVSVRNGAPEPDPGTARVEITWTAPRSGRIPLPLRPPAALGLDLLDVCRTAVDRPIPWCLIAFATADPARLMAQLSESWGPGIACLTRENHVEGDHGLPRSEAALIQRRSAVRVWWGGGDYLDPFLVLESLCHGCLPLQCVPGASHEALTACVPRGLSRFTLAIPDLGTVPPISPEERAARLDAGLSVVLAGNLERDLDRLKPLIECGAR